MTSGEDYDETDDSAPAPRGSGLTGAQLLATFAQPDPLTEEKQALLEAWVEFGKHGPLWQLVHRKPSLRGITQTQESTWS